jgi:cation transport regulator ChaC
MDKDLDEETRMTESIGILAYGSLISDPGTEIAAATIRVIADIETPFAVEYARSSNSRGGAPTLIPVQTGGSKVRGQIIVVDASVDEATHMLYRREIHEVGSGKLYKPPSENAIGRVRVKTIDGPFENVATVLYTDIDSNITDLTAGRLASLAIESVLKAKPEEDGISYLLNTRGHGIRTPLSDAYTAEILRQSGASTLEDALRACRSD